MMSVNASQRALLRLMLVFFPWVSWVAAIPGNASVSIEGISATGSRGNSSTGSTGSAFAGLTANSSNGSAANAPSSSNSSAANTSTTGNASTAIFTYDVANVPAAGSGSAYASACNSALYNYYYNSSAVVTSTLAASFDTITIEYNTTLGSSTITELALGATPYTLCDGVPRIDGYTSVEYFNVTLASTTALAPVYVTSTLPPPSCSIQPSDCAALYSSYAAYESSLSANALYNAEFDAILPSGVTPTPAAYPSIVVSPLCGSASPTALPPSNPYGTDFSCNDNTATVQLLYWPVGTASDCNLCSRSTCSTFTMTQTIPGLENTAVYQGTTLTSPTVYFTISGTWSYTVDGTATNNSQFLLPMSSTDVSTLCQVSNNQYLTRSLNYADLNYPFPADAYQCQLNCWSASYNSGILWSTVTMSEPPLTETEFGQTFTYPGTTWADVEHGLNVTSIQICSTIYENQLNYQPAVIPPSQFPISAYFFDPSLGDQPCQWNYGIAIFYDPPSALAAVPTQAQATLPGYLITTTTSAAPGTSRSAVPMLVSSTPSVPQSAASSPTALADQDGVSSPSSVSGAASETSSPLQSLPTAPADGNPVSGAVSDTPTALAIGSPAPLSSPDASSDTQTGIPTSTWTATGDPYTGLASTAAGVGGSSVDPSPSHDGMISPVITITAGTHTFLAAEVSGRVPMLRIAPGVTLTAGEQVTVAGMTLSLASDGDQIVVDGHTQTLAAAAVAASSSNAGSIWSSTSSSPSALAALATSTTTVSASSVQSISHKPDAAKSAASPRLSFSRSPSLIVILALSLCAVV